MRFLSDRRLLTLVAFLAGGAAFWVLSFSPGQTCNRDYTLLNPQLPCESSIQKGEWDYEHLRDLLTRKKSALKEEEKLTHLSVYFRDLGPGPRFGVGEYDKFQPASLSKVPVLIALLHKADYDLSFLDKTLSFTGSLGTNLNVEEESETLKPETPYTIRELLRKMIVYSDNYSYVLLVKELNSPSPLPAYFTFRDLDVLKMMLSPNADFVSIQSYGNLFGILYNTGYLSKEMSQFALELLSESTFVEGIVAGVPAGTRVAHKYGIRDPEGPEIQLHDCGIVYHPSTPYILCVMTSGNDLDAEKQAIADISRTVYEEVLSSDGRE